MIQIIYGSLIAIFMIGHMQSSGARACVLAQQVTLAANSELLGNTWQKLDLIFLGHQAGHVT